MFGRLSECFRIDTYSVAFDVYEYRYERHLDFVKEVFGRLLFQLLLEHVLQFQCNVRIFAGITVHIFRRKVAHILLVFASCPDKFVDVDSAVVQVDFGQVVHVVAKLRLQYIMGKHGIEKFPLYLHSVILQDNHVVLDILPYLHGIFVFVQGAELVYDF